MGELEKLDRWPEIMRNLVRKHGGKAVWDAGMKVMGFPATWIQETASAVQVAGELERQEKELKT